MGLFGKSKNELRLEAENNILKEEIEKFKEKSSYEIQCSESLSNYQPFSSQKKSRTKGCLTFIITLFIIGGFITFFAAVISGNTTSKLIKHLGVTKNEAKQIEEILADLDIKTIRTIAHDELLDNAHLDGETGYRISTNAVKNIILYMSPDKTVNQVIYIDHILYSAGTKQSSLKDHIISNKEAGRYQNFCEEAVKELLKTPASAKFPTYKEWAFGKEKNILTVQGYVDSQNSFGAEIRSQFQIVIDMNGNNIQSLVLDGKEYIKK